MNKFLALLLVAIVAMTMGERAPWVPRETGLVPPAVAAAAAPAPAPETVVAAAAISAPGPATTANTWVNSQTCGWVAGVSSYPWTCDKDYACATNKAHVVGCASGTYSPLFSVCVDYSAVVAGSCDVANTNSGCCTYTDFPACGTYLWTGTPARSMYRCFPASSVVTMLDEPQFMLDSQTSPSTSTSSDNGGVAASPTATPSSSNTDAGSGGGGDDKETITVVAISVGTILGFFLVLGLVRFAASFRAKFVRRRDGRNANGNGNESHIELVDLPQQQQRQQQQQQQEPQV
ncbi:hypothetical protein PG993_010928 [Apiospora rasikravindrae]|uniref:Membrane-associated protein n=1 Tax=Apiospora rasikravindrae TaxID=990691 RepID=A0ABR1SF04_9PEZI